jgi:hypothetical protein
MNGAVLVALIVVIPVILFPAAFVWYLNIGGLARAYRQARAGRKAEAKQ